MASSPSSPNMLVPCAMLVPMYSHRSPWLRAFVLGGNDGLISVACLMVSASLPFLRLLCVLCLAQLEATGHTGLCPTPRSSNDWGLQSVCSSTIWGMVVMMMLSHVAVPMTTLAHSLGRHGYHHHKKAFRVNPMPPTVKDMVKDLDEN